MPQKPRRAARALDAQTEREIRELARAWGVSPTEVVRRSVRAAAERDRKRLTPADVVAYYRSNPLPPTRRETLRRVHAMRAWRRADDERRR